LQPPKHGMLETERGDAGEKTLGVTGSGLFKRISQRGFKGGMQGVAKQRPKFAKEL